MLRVQPLHLIPPDDEASDENDLDLSPDRSADTAGAAAAAMGGLGSSGPSAGRDRDADAASASASSASGPSGPPPRAGRPRFGRTPADATGPAGTSTTGAAAATPGGRGGLRGLRSFRTGGGLLAGAAGAGTSTGNTTAAAAAAAGTAGGGLPQQQPQAKQQRQRQQQQQQQSQTGSSNRKNLPGIRVARRTSELSLDGSLDGSASDLSMASASAVMEDEDEEEEKVAAPASQAQASDSNGNGSGRPHPAHRAGSAYLGRLLAAKQRQMQGTGTNTGSGGGGRGLGLGLGLGIAPVGGGGLATLLAFGRGAAKAKAKAAAASAAAMDADQDKPQQQQQQQQQQQHQTQPVRAYDLFHALEANVLGGRAAFHRRSSDDSGAGGGGSSGSLLPTLEASPSITDNANHNAASAMGSSSSAQRSVLALRRPRGHDSAAPTNATGQQGSTFATNSPAQPAATFHRRRPRKVTSAYTYFFREKCRGLAQTDGGYDEYAAAGWRPGGKKRASQTEGDDEGRGNGPAQSSPTDAPEKRQRSNVAGASIDASPAPAAGVPAEEMGKIAAQQWRTMSSFEKAKYEEMAERDAERYREEVEEYYKGSSGAVAASMLSGRAGGHPLLRISAGGADAMTDLVATNSRSGGTTANNPRKTALQQMLAAKRSELLNDISSLNEISSSRAAAGRPALQQNAEVRQRLYNLAVGPGGSAAAGPSTWNRARLTAGGVVTPTDGSPRTSIGGLATGASASGLGMSNLPSSSTGPAFGRPISASASATAANLAERHLHTKSDVTIERLDDSMHDSA